MAIFKNRRENVLINELPSEIPSAEGIEKAVEKVTDGKLLPSGGNIGNVLKKKADGSEWGTITAGSDITTYNDANLTSATLDSVWNDIVAGKYPIIRSDKGSLGAYVSSHIGIGGGNTEGSPRYMTFVFCTMIADNPAYVCTCSKNNSTAEWTVIKRPLYNEEY